MISRKEARKLFWEQTFKKTFPYDYDKILKMSYHGSEIDSFINKIYDSIGSCKTCKYSILFDNELYCGFVKVGNEEKKEDNWFCADYEKKEN